MRKHVMKRGRLETCALVSLAVAVSMLGASEATASAPPALAPAARWSLGVEPESCALSRTFGSGEGKVVLQLTAFHPSSGLFMMLIGKPAASYSRNGPLWLRFEPAGQRVAIEPTAARVVQVSVDHTPVRAVIVTSVDLAGRRATTPGEDLPPLTDAALSQTTALTAEWANSGFRLDLGSMLPPITALRKCVDAMVGRWGYDVGATRRVEGRPVPLGRPGEWATDLDYPLDAIAKGIESDVHFRLSIDAAGKISDCVIQDPFPPLGFAELTCRLLRSRARFRPASDSSGKPIASFYASAVRWRIPRR